MQETLRSRRESLGLNAVELAVRANVAVEVVLRAEFGEAVPSGTDVRARLAAAYDLEVRAYLDLAFDAAERNAERRE